MDLNLFYRRFMEDIAAASEAAADALHERAVVLDALHAESIHGTSREVMYDQLQKEALTYAIACDAFAKALRQRAKLSERKL